MITGRRAVALLVAVALVGCSDSRPGSPASSSSPATTATSALASTTTADPDYAPGRHTISLDVDGIARTAVLVVPSAVSAPAPLVFVFHGHGGSGAGIEGRVQIEQRWPDAIVVYPDGLVGHKGITDPQGVRPGWQVAPGGEGDRDLAFYDTLLATIRSKLPVDGDRIYVMGHSNGSAFASLLLNQRGDSIAATANLSAQPGPALLATDPVRSMFMSMGETDAIVPFDQQQPSIPLAEQKLGVDTANPTVDGYLRSERGPHNLELATYVHPGGHDVPADVPPLVVAFFRRHTLSGG